jgi:hypothetical protein
LGRRLRPCANTRFDFHVSLIIETSERSHRPALPFHGRSFATCAHVATLRSGLGSCANARFDFHVNSFVKTTESKITLKVFRINHPPERLVSGRAFA